MYKVYPTLVSEIEGNLKTDYFFGFYRILQSWKIFPFQNNCPGSGGN